MNLAIFLLPDTVESMKPILKAMAERQKQQVNGCLCVIHSDHIPKDVVLEVASELASRFVTSASLPVQVNNQLSLDARMAHMFGHFLLEAYASYPGPWLLFDEPAEPVKDDFMQLIERQHGAFGGKMTGRADCTPGGARPIGPVTLELNQHHLKFLRYSTTESWRSRGRYLFVQAGFRLVPQDQWLFSMSADPVSNQEPAKPAAHFLSSLDDESGRKSEKKGRSRTLAEATSPNRA